MNFNKMDFSELGIALDRMSGRTLGCIRSTAIAEFILASREYDCTVPGSGATLEAAQTALVEELDNR